MTTRFDVSVLRNKYHDAQRVDQTDMTVEQNYNVNTNAAIVGNFFGSGVLPSSPEPIILFDSSNLDSVSAALVASGDFDGTGISVSAQPTDINLGNQIEVELTGSAAFGRLSTKVAIIGLSFDDTLQTDKMYFYKNEKQVTSKHYKRILTVLFNDFLGNNNCSRTLGGKIVLREASSFQLSRNPIMVSQEVEPDIFWRDFKVANSGIALFTTIQNAIGSDYNADALSINVTEKTIRQLLPSDVTSHVGQKFKAATNNIQKITLLMGALRDASAAEANKFDWSGDLIISIYPLQTSTSCPADIIPELAIEFDPTITPLAQLSINQASLLDQGSILTDVLQPIDFVFNATAVSTAGAIAVNSFYAVTVKRAGAASIGSILFGTGNDKTVNSRLTLFSNVWVDVPEDDMWFQVWSDAAKISDGMGFDAGNGIMIPKTTINAATGTTIDKEEKNKSFQSTGENTLNVGIIQALNEESATVQDERTGNSVFSRQMFDASFSFVSETGLDALQTVSDPLIIGCVQDTNPKQNANLTKTQSFAGLAKGNVFTIIKPDADLLSLNLLGSKLIPNSACSDIDYRIFSVYLCTDGYGDINGDGIIDDSDISRASDLIGEGLALDTTQQKIVDGYFTTLEILRADVDGDGYVTSSDLDLIISYVNKTINSFPVGATFQHMDLKLQQSVGRFDGYFDCGDGYVRIDGYTGSNIVDSSSLSALELLYDGYLVDPVLELDPAFSVVPFQDITYQIKAQPYWQPQNLALSSSARLVPAAFTFENAIVPYSCSSSGVTLCENRNNIIPECDAGRNDFFVPSNLYIGTGEILRPDGSNYSVDLEIGTVILQLPEIEFNEAVINVFDKFVADRGDGLSTRAGYPIMRYSDCSTVQDEDLFLGKVRFGVSVQSLAQNLDGYDGDGYGIIVDPILGTYMNQATGILTLNVRDLEEDPIFKTLVTKIQIQVFLKKAGWKNSVLEIDSDAVAGLLST